MGPSLSLAMATLVKITSRAWEDWVPGVTLLDAIDIAARTSGGRSLDVRVIISSKLPARNSIAHLSNSILHFSNPDGTNPGIHARHGRNSLPLPLLKQARDLIAREVRSRKREGRRADYTQSASCCWLPTLRSLIRENTALAHHR